MKYQNNSGLKQIALINGKKEIVPNGAVFETDRPIMHPGFDKVDESTPVTFKKLVPKLVKNDSLDSLQKQIDDLTSINNKVEELSQKTNDIDRSNDISELSRQIGVLTTETKENFAILFKRVEILKNAVQTIELEVDQALYGEDDSTKSR
jgi:hypothetical protein